MRLSSLEATLTLLRNEDCAPEMNALVTRFRDRLIEMTQDVDANVAVHAYSVLIECSKSAFEICWNHCFFWHDLHPWLVIGDQVGLVGGC